MAADWQMNSNVQNNRHERDGSVQSAESAIRDCTARLLGRMDVLISKISALNKCVDSMPERIAASIRGEKITDEA